MESLYKEVESIEELRLELQTVSVFEHYAFQDIDFNEVVDEVRNCNFIECLFMGCDMPQSMMNKIKGNSYHLPKMDLPFNVFPARLYTAKDLYLGYELNDAEYYDKQVYTHYLTVGKHTKDIKETLARSLHDHSINNALTDLLSNYREEDIVAVMGGHAILRTDKTYREVAALSKRLTERGKIMISGGGPGAMEAVHLGAWLSGYDDNVVDEAIEMLSEAATFSDKLWIETAFKVIDKFPQQQFISVGIPTWFYGHEPATPFATHIAKMFHNSIREDGLLAVAKGGVVYAPGSAGTLQEVFQDAAQNHYRTFGWSSPMIFFNSEYWLNEVPVYPFISNLVNSEKYKNLKLSISDDINKITDILINFIPKK